MVNATVLRGDHDVFVSGNNKAATAKVTEILKNWSGWKSVVDLGDITSARGVEQVPPLWLHIASTLGTANFNLRIVR